MSIVFISEITYDVVGTDTGEAIEIMAPAGTDLTGWRVVLYNGGSNAASAAAATVYSTTTLSGLVTDLGGGQGAMVINYPSDGIQNGANDAIALIDPYGNVVQFLSYEGVVTAGSGPAMGQTSVNIGVSQGGSTPVGESLQVSGTGGDSANFTWSASAANTFGASNTGMTYNAPDTTFSATAGDDIDFEGTYGIDVINGLDGNDVLRALWGDDTVNGDAGDDVLQGMRGDDILNGGDGNDTLSGGLGADTMSGGTGNDIYVIDDLGDVVFENDGEGTDEVRSIFDLDISALTSIENGRLQGTAINLTGSDLANSLWGNASNNVIAAGSGDDLVYGGAGNDSVSGDAGNDTLRGDAGNDTLDGGAGRDILTGGTGADNFYFASGDFSGSTLATADWIRDFSQADGDLITLDLGVTATFIGDLAFTQSGNAEVRFQAQGTNTMVYVDLDGDAVADFAIRLTGVIDLTSNDFQLTVPVG